jgi:hypothetical protein
MKLEIVWRNPVPVRETKNRVELIVVDEFGALYSAVGADGATAFEVILGGAA